VKSVLPIYRTKLHSQVEAVTWIANNIEWLCCSVSVLSCLVRQICRILQIQKTRTTLYHPASNGQVERYNSLILQTIRCFIKRQQNRWDEHLQLLAAAIHATDNRQTRFSANFLMFCREVTRPTDLTWSFDHKYTGKGDIWFCSRSYNNTESCSWCC